MSLSRRTLLAGPNVSMLQQINILIVLFYSTGQLSPNSAALGLPNVANQKSPVPDIKPDPAGIAAAMAKEDMMNANAKMLLKQLSQEHLPQQQQKSMPGSIMLPNAESSSEELTIHPGGSGETSDDVIIDRVTYEMCTI